MKILRLKLQNLASLSGEQEINFEADPLVHAGLIAITGSTGAGKSTLLDAMCLALFDQIPRLKQSDGKLRDASGQDISIKDTKNILRRGTTSGFAELDFVGLDQKHYRARWEIRRARNKLDGNLKIDRSVLCLDDQRVLTQKISECNDTIFRLIGLSFEQFTRAVLLAQSEVGAFLKAKDQERADLLEYLTNSNIFSQVGKAAFEKTKAIRLEKEKFNDILGHIELLTAEQVTQLQQALQQQEQNLQQLQQNKSLLEREWQWHQRQHELHAEIQGKQEIYQLQLAADQQLNTEREKLQQLSQFAEIRSSVEQQQQLQQQHIQLQQQLQQLESPFSALQSEFKLKEHAYFQAEQQ